MYESGHAEQSCCDEILRLMRETGKAGLANADITLLTADRIRGQGIVERLTE
jgi:hypothetical protein